MLQAPASTSWLCFALCSRLSKAELLYLVSPEAQDHIWLVSQSQSVERLMSLAPAEVLRLNLIGWSHTHQPETATVAGGVECPGWPALGHMPLLEAEKWGGPCLSQNESGEGVVP